MKLCNRDSRKKQRFFPNYSYERSKTLVIYLGKDYSILFLKIRGWDMPFYDFQKYIYISIYYN